MDGPSFVKPIDGFGKRVVIAVANTADRGLNARFHQPLGLANGDILRPAIAVMDQTAAMQRPPLMQCLVRRQRLWDQSGDLRHGGFLAHRNPKESED